MQFTRGFFVFIIVFISLLLLDVRTAYADNWWGSYTCDVNVDGKKCELDLFFDSICSNVTRSKTCTVQDISCGETLPGITELHQTGCSGIPNSCSATYTTSLCTCTAPDCDNEPTPTLPPGAPTPTDPPDACAPGFTCTNGGTCCRYSPDTPSTCT